MEDRPLDLSKYLDFDPKTIKVLESRDAIRLRPAMYIGFNLDAGLVALATVTVDILLAYEASGFSFTLHADHSLTIIGYGPGLPVHQINTPRHGSIPMAQALLTMLGIGPGPSIGLVTTNSLSQHLEVTIWREGQTWKQSYREGLPLDVLHETGTTEKQGTCIHYLPDPAIFSDHHYDFDLLVRWFRDRASALKEPSFKELQERYINHLLEAAKAYCNIHFTITDERSAEPRVVSFEPE